MIIINEKNLAIISGLYRKEVLNSDLREYTDIKEIIEGFCSIRLMKKF